MLFVMSVMPSYILLTAEYSIYGHAVIYFRSLKLIAIFCYFHVCQSHKFCDDRLVQEPLEDLWSEFLGDKQLGK